MKVDREILENRDRNSKRIGDAVNIYKGEFYLLRICQRQV
jgi:hypothetical protein